MISRRLLMGTPATRHTQQPAPCSLSEPCPTVRALVLAQENRGRPSSIRCKAAALCTDRREGRAAVSTHSPACGSQGGKKVCAQGLPAGPWEGKALWGVRAEKDDEGGLQPRGWG